MDQPACRWGGVDNMFIAYGPDHRRRSLIASALTARRVEALHPAMEQLTTDLLDELAATPPGVPVDLRDAYAYPIPIEVICRLFDAPDPPIVVRVCG